MFKIKRILCPTDFSTCSKQAFPQALFWAEKYGAELHLLHVITMYTDDPYDPSFDFPSLKEYCIHLEKAADDKAEKMIQKHTINKAKIIKVQKRGYSPSGIILEYANDKKIDLIVMGTHGRHGLGYLFLGSVSEEITRFAHCPVYTVREQKIAKPIEKLNRILVPVDFSDHSKKALAYAKVFCKEYDAKLEILHIIEDRIHPALYATGKASIFDLIPDIKEKSSKMISDMVQEVQGPEVEVKIKIAEGVAAREILKYAEQNKIDLIIISTHGRSGLNHFLLGSVAEKIVRRSICPVFTVKSFGKHFLKQNPAK